MARPSDSQTVHLLSVKLTALEPHCMNLLLGGPRCVASWYKRNSRPILLAFVTRNILRSGLKKWRTNLWSRAFFMSWNALFSSSSKENMDLTLISALRGSEEPSEQNISTSSKIFKDVRWISLLWKDFQRSLLLHYLETFQMHFYLSITQYCLKTDSAHVRIPAK